MLFQYFLDAGFVKRQRKDFARAKNLVNEAENRLRFLKTINFLEENTNYIVENIYDIIRELIEARLSIDGFKSYSHEATVVYLRILKFPEGEIRFLDELRRIRNGIKYYGKNVNMVYARKTQEFLKKIRNKLKKLVEGKIIKKYAHPQ